MATWLSNGIHERTLTNHIPDRNVESMLQARDEGRTHWGVIATCGHDVTAIWEQEGQEATVYFWPITTRMGESAWAYGTLCPGCVPIYNGQKQSPFEQADAHPQD